MGAVMRVSSCCSSSCLLLLSTAALQPCLVPVDDLPTVFYIQVES